MGHPGEKALACRKTTSADVERGFAAQGMLGITFEATPRLSLDLVGRYMGTEKNSFGSVT